MKGSRIIWWKWKWSATTALKSKTPWKSERTKMMQQPGKSDKQLLMRRRTLSRDLLPHLDQSITELLRCYLALLTVASGTREHGRQSVVSAPTRPGIVMHQVEPRTTAAAAGTIAGPRISFWLLWPGLCLHMDVRLQTELFMLNDVLQTCSHLSHVLRLNLLSSVKSTGCHWWTCQFWYSITSRAPRGSEHRAR